MHHIEITRKNLKYILKKGDLYDVLAQKEEVDVKKGPFWRANLFVFSRILYGGLLVLDKIKSRFSPVQKVHDAQEEIRDILGVNVDIVRTKCNFIFSKLEKLIKRFAYKDKTPFKHLAILYEDRNVDMEGYLSSLKKIYDFCELYKIPEILLNEGNITSLFADVNLDSFEKTSLKAILDVALLNDTNSTLLKLKPNDLLKLINLLKSVKTNKKYILKLGENIEDLTIFNALQDFVLDNDLEKLKMIIKSRLNLYLNSESSYKDRVNGKVFQNITLEDEYLKVLTSNQNGDLIGNTVVSLYEFLDVLSYDNLLEEMDRRSDEKELLAIAALYLYLYRDEIKNKKSNRKNFTFYDKLYRNYQEKQKKETNEVKGLQTKKNRSRVNFTNIFASFMICYMLALLMSLGCITYDTVQTFFFRNEDKDRIENITNTLILPYKYSLEFEENLVQSATSVIGGIVSQIRDKLPEVTGDAFFLDETKVIGQVKTLNDDFTPPNYFATGYASSGTYSFGKMSYEINKPLISRDDFQNVESLFQVSVPINKMVLRGFIKNDMLNLPQILYPVGKDFVLTKVQINDEKTGWRLTWDLDHFFINEVEEEILRSMQEPEIIYTYGLSFNGQNAFVENIEKDGSYTNLSNSEIRDVITEGLGLNKDATLDEIMWAIKNKTYSKTPIKDAGLSWKIKIMSEKDYFKTISSMDSLVCNLAATLAVEVDEDLIYIAGYYNDNDDTITGKEAHAWAMYQNGQIVDITPSTALKDDDNEINDAINSILIWGMENKIHIYIILALIAAHIKKKYGKSIVFKVKILNAKRLINKPNIEEDYAEIKEVLYGGVNIPIKRTPSEFVDAISREFAGFSREELEELKEELKMSKASSRSMKIVSKMDFIKSNSDELKRVLEKKKK